MTTLLFKILRFQLERWIQRGMLHQLILMAVVIAFVAVAGGLAAWLTTAKFEAPEQAIWWAFLRLTDPGYLGDDEGAVLRWISTIITILGYVLFMGSLIAIMAQGLAYMIRELESGHTSIAMRDHVVILGWTNRTPEIVSMLLSARGRLQRFLDRRSVSKLRVVILSQEVNAQRRRELRDHLKEGWDESRIFLRSGSMLRPEHLQRLALERAAAIVIPGADFALGGVELTDTRVIKTLLTINSFFLTDAARRRPDIVAEIFDPLKVSVARSTVKSNIEIISSDIVIARLLAQGIRHRCLAGVLLQLLSHRRGNSLYVRDFPEFVGEAPVTLHERFPKAIVLGALRYQDGQFHPYLNPPSDFLLDVGDQLVFLAQKYDDCEPSSQEIRPPRVAVRTPVAHTQVGLSKRILVLGWNSKIGALVTELGGYAQEQFDITIMSRVPGSERERWLKSATSQSDRLDIQHVEGDYALLQDLERVDPMRFNNIVLLASDWLNSSEESDARTVLGYVLLTSMFQEGKNAPEMVVELLDPDNASLLSAREQVLLVSPQVLSHMMAHVSLRRELNSVFNALFGTDGVQILLRRASDYGLADQSVHFDEIQRVVSEHNELALGLLSTSCSLGSELNLNPVREERHMLTYETNLLVLRG